MPNELPSVASYVNSSGLAGSPRTEMTDHSEKIQEIEKLTDLNLLAADRKVQSLQLTATLGCIQG